MSKENTGDDVEQPSLSTQLIPPSRWSSGSFQLAAGCCMIQPSTGKIVVVKDTSTGRWFLPRGRKDIGETLEQAAFREGYEVCRNVYTLYLLLTSDRSLGKWVSPTTSSSFITS
jgi:hypothetical protein